MREIKKKTWSKYFQLMLDGKKNVDLRLKDFDIDIGDIIIFEEYDPANKTYSGRTIKRTVTNLSHVHLTDFHSISDIMEKGHWIIESELYAENKYKDY